MGFHNCFYAIHNCSKRFHNRLRRVLYCFMRFHNCPGFMTVKDSKLFSAVSYNCFMGFPKG